MDQNKNKKEIIGKIIAVSDLNVTVLCVGSTVKNKEILMTEYNGKTYRFEVSDVNGNQVSCIPLERVIGLKKGLEVVKLSDNLEITYNDNMLGRVFSSYGEAIDNKPEAEGVKRSIYAKNLTLEEIDISGEPLWTGIKVLDFFAPMQKGYKMGDKVIRPSTVAVAQ